MVPDTRTRLEAALADLEGVLVRRAERAERERRDLVSLARAPFFSQPSPPFPTSPSLTQDATAPDAVEAADLAGARDIAATAKAQLAAA